MGFLKKLSRIFFKGNERREVSFYRGLIPPESLCFDIGANEGKKTGALLAIPAKVVAVEPDETLCELLNKKFGDRLTVVCMGVSDSEGTEKFFKSNHSEVSTFSEKFIQTFSHQKFLSWDEGAEVKTTTLQSLVEKFGTPFFIKIDTEGYEEKVLSGLNKKIGLIEFEYTAPFAETAVACISKIESLGNYQFNFSEYESYTFRYRGWLSSIEMTNEIPQLKVSVKHGNVFARLLS